MSVPSGVLAILGPTATGKSELAVALAERLGGEIVSADAFAVYRGFDVGTAKPGPELRARVPHHLVDARDPTEPWSAGEFAAEARRLCGEILSRGRLPILAGGTGFYVRAFFGGLFEGPRRDDAVRRALEAVQARRGPGSLRRMVSLLDPEVAVAPRGGRHDPGDPRARDPVPLGRAPVPALPRTARRGVDEAGREAPPHVAARGSP